MNILLDAGKRVLVLVSALVFACVPDRTNGLDASRPEPSLNDAGTTDSGIADAGTSDAEVPTSCLEAGGVCTGSSSACETGGGTVRSEFASDCIFSDGLGACCVPPVKQPSGDTCSDHGGMCTPVGGCFREEIRGHFAPPSCGGVLMMCCVPATACSEPRPECCSTSATFRATCDRGQYTCLDPSWTLRNQATCP